MDLLVHVAMSRKGIRKFEKEFEMTSCLIVILSLFAPRMAIIMFAIFTNWVSLAYETVLWPVLGCIFMPFTTLVYMVAMIQNDYELTGGYLVLLIVAVIFDLASSNNARSSSD